MKSLSYREFVISSVFIGVYYAKGNKLEFNVLRVCIIEGSHYRASTVYLYGISAITQHNLIGSRERNGHLYFAVQALNSFEKEGK